MKSRIGNDVKFRQMNLMCLKPLVVGSTPTAPTRTQ